MKRCLLLMMVLGAALYGQSQSDSVTITGRWHLLAAAASQPPLLSHYVDLRFWKESDTWKGAVISRRDGTTLYALAAVSMDGSTLRFQMTAPAGKAQSEMPTMVMTRHGERWEGKWTSGDSMAVQLIPADR